MISIRGYYNTGFNPVNSPETPSVLETADYKDFPVMDILQLYFNDTFRIKATEEEIRGIDFFKLTKNGDVVYYAVAGRYTMTSADIASVPVVIDAILTAGGIQNIDIRSGIVQRTSVLPIDAINPTDFAQKYCVYDELMVPTGSPNVNIGYEVDVRNPGTYLLVKSSLPLDEILSLPMDSESFTYTFNENSATLPSLPTYDNVSVMDQNFCFFKMPALKSGTLRLSAEHVYETFIDRSGVWFKFDYMELQTIVAKLLSYGAVDAILDAYVLPKSFVDEIVVSGHVVKSIKGAYVYSYLHIAGETPLPKEDDDLAAFILSEHNKLAFMTASGDTFEAPLMNFNFDSQHITGEDVDIPYVMAVDPGPNGKPYYVFEMSNTFVHDNTVFSEMPQYDFIPVNIYPNVIAGLEWAKPDILAVGRSGFAVEHQRFKNSVQMEDFKHEPLMQYALNGGVAKSTNSVSKFLRNIGGVGTAAGIGVDAAYTNTRQALFDTYNPLTNADSAVGAAMLGNPDYLRRYLARSKEIADFELNNAVPSTNTLIVRTPSLRDYFGNGFIWKLTTGVNSETCNKIIKRFGFKTNYPIDKKWSFTGEGILFDANCKYLQIASALVSYQKLYATKYDMNIELRELIREQLSVGVRFWNKLPTVL